MRDILISRFPITIVIWIDEYGHIEKDERERQRLSKEINELMNDWWED